MLQVLPVCPWTRRRPAGQEHHAGRGRPPRPFTRRGGARGSSGGGRTWSRRARGCSPCLTVAHGGAGRHDPQSGAWRRGRRRSKTQPLLDSVDEILEQYAEQLPLTLRQVFYRLVAQLRLREDRAGLRRLGERFEPGAAIAGYAVQCHPRRRRARARPRWVPRPPRTSGRCSRRRSRT